MSNLNENAYFKFFETEDEAITHCRKRNRGLDSKDARCMAVIDGPGCIEEHADGCPCCAYAVVDMETALDILDSEESRLAPLVVTG